MAVVPLCSAVLIQLPRCEPPCGALHVPGCAVLRARPGAEERGAHAISGQKREGAQRAWQPCMRTSGRNALGQCSSEAVCMPACKSDEVPDEAQAGVLGVLGVLAPGSMRVRRHTQHLGGRGSG